MKSPDMADAAITFDNLTLGYGSHAAVHHLSGAVAKGTLLAVVGANGSGKSTLLKGIAGAVKPMAGGCRIAPGSRVAYLPQQSELDRTFPARVVDLVSLGVWPRRGLLGRHTAEDRAAIEAALEAVGLAGFARRGLDTLSGGQLQRALFARVLVQDADLILLDEPFNAIDAKTIADLTGMIRRWHGEGRSVLVVAHDLELVRQHMPETLLLARRPVAWGRTADVLRSETLQRARGFDEAWHDDAPWCEPAGSNRHDHDHDHDDHDHDGHHHEHHHHQHDPVPAASHGRTEKVA